MAFYTNAIHATKRFKLGTRKQVDQNEYIYLKGVASTLVGSWVTFDQAGTTTLAVANGKGRVAIAMAITDTTSKFGWYQIYGSASGLALASFAAGGKVWLTATPGSVDDADVAVDIVVGAIGRSTIVGAGLATFELNFPICHNEVLN